MKLFQFLRTWWKNRKDVVVVATFTNGWSMGHTKFDQIFTLYENANGKRFFTVDYTEKIEEKLQYRSTYYIEKVAPWMNGAPVADIDTFEEAKRKIFIAKLTR